MSTPQIESSWLNVLQSEFEEDYMQELRTFFAKRYVQDIRYTLLWINSSQHFGIPLSGCKGCHSRSGPISWSKAGTWSKFFLFCSTGNTSTTFFKKYIYKERQVDLGIVPTEHGDLSEWSKRGVLLLNTALTVRARSAGSYQGKGWERFTDRVIFELNEQREHLVFVLWGKKAQVKTSMINAENI